MERWIIFRFPSIPELLRAKVSVFAELHRKTRQLEALNRDLEHRVLERTDELATQSRTPSRSLTAELLGKNQELDAIVSTAPDVIFSSQGDGHYEYVSERFHEYTGAPAEPGTTVSVGWTMCILMTWSAPKPAGCSPCRQDRVTKRNIVCGPKMAAYRWFRSRAVPIRDPEGKIVKWYGTCSDIHDSKLLEHSIRDSAVELEKMVDRRTDELRRLSVRLMAVQDQERRRIARDFHDGLGQELAVAKMMLDKMFLQNPPQPQEETCTKPERIIERAIQQVRTMSHLLHPPLLDEVGLLSALAGMWRAIKAKRNRNLLDVQPPRIPEARRRTSRRPSSASCRKH